MLADKHWYVGIEKVIHDAVAGEGRAASLSPEQVVMLLAEYHCRFGPRWDREVRAWWELADKVTKKYRRAVQQAILAGTKLRDEFIRSLGRVGGQENISFLSELAEKSPSRWVARALGMTKSRDAWPVLRKLLAHEDFTIAAVAMEELTHAGDTKAIPAVQGWLESGDENKRKAALDNCQTLGAPALLPTLNRIDSVVTGEERAALYLAFAHCGDRRYLDQIHTQAQDESEYKASLERRGPDPAERILSWNYRQNKALSAIAKLGDSRSLPVLDKLSKEASDPKIRGRATRIANDIRKKTNRR
jgi:HEAT repeat protein